MAKKMFGNHWQVVVESSDWGWVSMVDSLTSSPVEP